MDTATKRKRKRWSAFEPGNKPLLTLAPDKEAYLDILDAMQDYDVLPASYIKALFDSEDYTRKLLWHLQKGHYIGVPDNYTVEEKRYRVRPLEIWPRGYEYLGSCYKRRRRVNDHINHKRLRSVMAYHRDQLPGVITELPNNAIQLEERSLLPDATWTIEYTDVATARMNFYQEDDDRNERLRGRETFELSGKSLRVMINGYVETLERGLHPFGTVMILIHTTGKFRAENILDLIIEIVPVKWQHRFAVMAVPNFLDEPLNLPAPDANLLAGDYTRIRNGKRERFNIVETLKATEQRKRGGESIVR